MGSLPQRSKPSPSYPPFDNTGTLDAFKQVHVTPCIGSEFKNVDVTEWLRAPNSDDILRDLALTIGERGVVFFRNQKNMDNKLQKEICKRLNDLSGAPKENTFYRHSLLAMQGEDPEMGKVDQDRIQKMYSPPVEGMPRQTHTKDWHTDSSFEPMPPSYTVLKMTDLPAAGGDTLWASGYELYDRLSAPYKRFFESLTATHKSTALSQAAKENPSGMDSGPRGAAGNTGLDFQSHHPVVRTHPLTGWKSLFAAGVNCFRIDDVTDMESAQIMDKVTRLITDNHDIQCRFRWEDTNDLAIWDNRCTFHAATGDHFGLGTRIAWRCMMMGEEPFLDPASKGRQEATGGWPYRNKAKLEIGQERSHPKPSADQENALVFPHWGTDSMRSTEQHPAGAECAAPFAGLSVIQELPGQSSASFHKQFQLVLLLVRSGRYHERMTLQKGRETYGRNSQVDVLSGFDLQRPGKDNLDLDRVFGVSDESSGMTVAEVPIPPQDVNALDD